MPLHRSGPARRLGQPRQWLVVGALAVSMLAGAAAVVWRGQAPADLAAGTDVTAADSHPDTRASAVISASVTATAEASRTSPIPTVAASAAAPGPGPGVRSAKKGVSAWYFEGFTQALAGVGAAWYYNWDSSKGNLNPPSGVEYVPMIWGPGSVTQSRLEQAKAQGKTLLGFNEPNLRGQADMPVDQALDLWPQLEATGLRLGSPAPAFGAATAGGWLDQFMSGAAQRGYRVDFIALHWYGSDFSAAATNQLRGYLQAVWDRYHKPIWLTEYALINFSGGTKYPTQDQQAAFARASVAMLESLSYVERYAWFALPATEDSGTGLYRDALTPTTVGAAYRDAK